MLSLNSSRKKKEFIPAFVNSPTMKLTIILAFAVVGAWAQCRRLAPGLKCTATEMVDGVERSYEVDPEDCHKHKQCCMKDGECVPKFKRVKKADDTSTLGDDYYGQTGSITDQANSLHDATVRSLPFVPGGFPSACTPPPPFPAKCKPARNEPYVFEPPHNIPYCVRIPCDPSDNSVFDKSHRKCGMQPGCYFDKELFEYREAFGESVLPGVPVCHLAIRNRFFQTKAQKVVQSYGSWNPYFTNCLLNEYDSEIRRGPVGCELLPVIEKFYVTPKLAGWSTINSYHCALIDGCWREGIGCFYPVDISNVRVKTGQRSILSQRKEIIYGRPKCQHFDKNSPLNILKSYHRCLSAGCSVDSSITDHYYKHLFSIGKDFTAENQWKYWEDVGKGLVGPYNIHDAVKRYAGVSVPPSLSKPSTPPTPSSPFDFPVGGFGPNPLPPKPSGSGCGHAFKRYGGRPCRPQLPKPYVPSKYCPYKSFFVPRFPTLKGSFEGCCDINLCYLPKSEISKMHSGPAHYYTEWSQWSACSVTCGMGQKERTRKCISQDRSKCTERLIDTRSCKEPPCADWSPWSSYTPCKVTCFPGGIQLRRRVCMPPSGHCPGPREQVRDCNKHVCDHIDAPNCSWTMWSPVPCSYNVFKKECENSRIRYCMCGNIPGGNCIGPAEEKSISSCFGCSNQG